MATACLTRQVRSRDTVALYGSCLIRQVRSLAVSVEALLKSMGGHVASACELHPPAAHPTPAPRQSGGGAPRYDNVGLAQARGHNLSSVDSSAVINRFTICNLSIHNLSSVYSSSVRHLDRSDASSRELPAARRATWTRLLGWARRATWTRLLGWARRGAGDGCITTTIIIQ